MWWIESQRNLIKCAIKIILSITIYWENSKLGNKKTVHLPTFLSKNFVLMKLKIFFTVLC